MSTLDFLTLEARRDLGTAFLDLAQGFQRVLEGAATPPPRVGGRAVVFASQQPGSWTWIDADPVKNAQDTAILTINSGLDHIEALASILRRPANIATANATLIRGVIEALGRGHYLLSSPTALELCRRDAWLTWNDLPPTRFVSEDETLATMGAPERISTRQFMDQLGADLVRNGPNTGKTGPSYTDLSSTLIDESGVGKGRAVYAHLAGIAHGASLHLHTFFQEEKPTDDPNEPGFYRIGINTNMATIYAMTVVFAVQTLAEDLFVYFGLTVQDRERWEGCRRRVHGRMQALLEGS